MTAIYAFVSKKHRLGVMVSDDLEANKQAKVDKIHFLENRFAIGICGLDIPKYSLDSINEFSKFDRHRNHDTLESLISEIFKQSKFVSEATFPGYHRQRNESEDHQKDYQRTLANSSELVIVDCKNYTLYQISFGYLYPPERIIKKPIIKKLKNDKLYLFAFSSYANNGDIFYKFLNLEEFIKSPIEYCKQKLNTDKLKFPSVKEVGNIGSTFMVRYNDKSYNSCFSSSFDIVSEWFKNFSSNGTLS